MRRPIRIIYLVAGKRKRGKGGREQFTSNVKPHLQWKSTYDLENINLILTWKGRNPSSNTTQMTMNVSQKHAKGCVPPPAHQVTAPRMANTPNRHGVPQPAILSPRDTRVPGAISSSHFEQCRPIRVPGVRIGLKELYFQHVRTHFGRQMEKTAESLTFR